jgi:hypothetical protein
MAKHSREEAAEELGVKRGAGPVILTEPALVSPYSQLSGNRNKQLLVVFLSSAAANECSSVLHDL